MCTVRGVKTLRLCGCEFFYEEHVKCLMLQLCEAILHLNRLRIIHCDMKPENLFLKDFGHIKIGDFGLSRIVEGTGELEIPTTCGGSHTYFAPELMNQETCGKEIDIWGLGIILYIALSGKHPWGQKRYAERVTEEVVFSEKVWGTISDNVKDLICKMLVVQPHLRLPATEVIRHDWFRVATVESNQAPKPPTRRQSVKHKKQEARKAQLLLEFKRAAAQELHRSCSALEAMCNLAEDVEGVATQLEALATSSD